MKVQRFASPYLNGKPRFKNSWDKSGVYIIKEKGKIVYVGRSGYNLYKTLYRHFQSWKSDQSRATYNKNNKDISVRVILTSKQQSYRLERVLTNKYKPRDAKYKYQKVLFDTYDKKVAEKYLKCKINDCPF